MGYHCVTEWRGVKAKGVNVCQFRTRWGEAVSEGEGKRAHLSEMENCRQELAGSLSLINPCSMHTSLTSPTPWLCRIRWHQAHTPFNLIEEMDAGEDEEEWGAKQVLALQPPLKFMTDVINKPSILHLHMDGRGYTQAIYTALTWWRRREQWETDGKGWRGGRPSAEWLTACWDGILWAPAPLYLPTQPTDLFTTFSHLHYFSSCCHPLIMKWIAEVRAFVSVCLQCLQSRSQMGGWAMSVSDEMNGECFTTVNWTYINKHDFHCHCWKKMLYLNHKGEQNVLNI